MSNRIRAACASLLVIAVLSAAGVAATKGTSKSHQGTSKSHQVSGEDDFRSATGYTVVLMEHCKAVNKLARNAGAFNVQLAREHAVEISRNAASVSKHLESYLAALGPEERTLVSDQSGSQQSGEAELARLAAALNDTLKGPSPDRKAVAESVTNLYLAAKGLLETHKAAGKALGIRAATPPHRAAPRKPKSTVAAVKEEVSTVDK